jgi:hypothetical protein
MTDLFLDPDEAFHTSLADGAPPGTIASLLSEDDAYARTRDKFRCSAATWWSPCISGRCVDEPARTCVRDAECPVTCTVDGNFRCNE